MTKSLIAVAGIAALATGASAQIYSNGTLADLQTGATTRSGVAAPAGGQWSEVVDNGVDAWDAVAGNNYANATFRIAENFTVPSGQTWNVTSVKFWTYQTGATTASLNNVTVQIFNTDPTLGGAAIWGDTTTNRFASNTLTNTYRTFNTVTYGGCVAGAPGTTRRLQEVTANITPPALTAGTYWISFGGAGTSTSGPWFPSRPAKPVGTVLQFPGANGLQSNAGLYALAAGDYFQNVAGTCTTFTAALNYEYAFQLFGTSGGGCRPDLTTTATPGTPGYGTPNGTLNSEDFFYFLAQYAANNLAVCDLTNTATPGSPGYGVPNGVLNSEDFFFYLALYATGC